MASARVQYWALVLSAYNYQIQYVPGKENMNADVFSCLPLPVQPKEVPTLEKLVFLIEGLEISPVTLVCLLLFMLSIIIIFRQAHKMLQALT